MEATNKTVFDIIVEQFINERLDDIMMQDTEYMKLQDKLWEEKNRLDKLDLSETQRLVVEKLISIHIRAVELYSKKSYEQGFRDCVSILREIGVVRKL